MRTILILAALLGCGGDSVHDEVDCAHDWGITTQRCERGCAAGPAGAIDTNTDGADDTCKPIEVGGTPCAVGQIATHDGERGCCRNAATVMRFHSCGDE